MAANAWLGDRNTAFYLAMAWLAAAAALAGFSTTWFFPMAGGTFHGPAVAYVHGLLFFSWIALLIVQVSLVRRRNLRLHKRLGLLALPLAPAMAVSCTLMGLYAVERDLAAGAGDIAYAQLIGVLMSMLIFLAFVAIALALRRRPDWHKRMMLLATIAILWPAWFRFRHFLTWVPRPDIVLAIVLADSLILLAIVRDALKFRRVHPAWLIFGLGLIAEHVAELLLYDTPAWRATARALYSALAL
jgi:hypothetical protein